MWSFVVLRGCLWRLILSDWSDKSDRSDQSEEGIAPHNRLANYSSSQPYNFATAALLLLNRGSAIN